MTLLAIKSDYERVLARYIAKIVPDLHTLDASRYICDLVHGHYGNIEDIIEGAMELYFFPRTLRFARGGDFHLEWGLPPIISLDMEFFNQGVRVLFRLYLCHDSFGIELERIRFGNGVEIDTASNYSNITRLLMALNDACLRKVA